jgi:hypothetical protein
MDTSIVRLCLLYACTLFPEMTTAFFRWFVVIIQIDLFSFILGAVRAQNTVMFNIYYKRQYGEKSHCRTFVPRINVENACIQQISF